MAEELTTYEKALLNVSENEELESLSVRQLKEVATVVRETVHQVREQTLSEYSTDSLLDELRRRENVLSFNDIHRDYTTTIDFTRRRGAKDRATLLAAKEVFIINHK